MIEYESIGCYKHKPGSKMIVLEGTDPQVLDGNYKHRADAIEKCALAAMKNDYLAFAVQDGGLCLGTCHSWGICVISQGGISQDCKSDGKGGSRAINVYAVGSIEGVIHVYRLLKRSELYRAGLWLSLSRLVGIYERMTDIALNSTVHAGSFNKAIKTNEKQ